MSPEAYLKMAEVEFVHWWFVGRRAIISSVLATFTSKYDSKILEVGCGTGGNLNLLGEYGAVSAFEMDETALKIAIQNSKGQHDLRLGVCPTKIPFDNEKFDIICMFDVLEHIPDDLGTLIKLKELLNAQGKIYITVPAYQWLYGVHDVFLHHKRRYTAGQLIKLARLAGLEPERITYFNTILFPIVSLFRIRDRLLKRSYATGVAIPLGVINFLLKSLFMFECKLLRFFNLPYGVSLLGVFRIENRA